MARRQHDLLVGLFALVALFVLGYMILQFGGGIRKYGDTIEVVGVFHQAGQLIENAPVYLSGVEIGRVSKIEVAPSGKVLVYMEVARQARLRDSDRPEIAQSGVLGDVVVNFVRSEARGKVARDGQRFVGADPVDIMRLADQVIRKINEVLDVLSSEETQGTVRGIMLNIEDLTGEENRKLLRTSLENLAELSDELRADAENLRGLFTDEFIDDARTIVANARVASENLPVLAKEGTLILQETRTHLVQLARNLTKNARRFDSILASVDEILATTARGEGTMGRLVNDPELYDSSVETLEGMRNAIVDIKYNLPFGIGRRIRDDEMTKAAEEAEATKIWRK